MYPLQGLTDSSFVIPLAPPELKCLDNAAPVNSVCSKYSSRSVLESSHPRQSPFVPRFCITYSNFQNLKLNSSELFLRLSSLLCTAMTTWFCVSSETTTLTVAGLVVLYLIFYWLMERKHSNPTSRKQEQLPFDYVQYERVDQTTRTESKQDTPAPTLLTTAQKLHAIKQILPTILCVVISWMSEFLVTQGVITTYAFPNSPFPPRDHYQYYITLFLLGEFIGRSYLAFVSLVKQEFLPKVMIRKLWLLTVIEVSILVFCLFAAWYRFLPNITILLFVSFLAGLIIGIMYANVLQVFTDSYEFPLREFVLGFVAVATGMGILIAGLLGLVVEPFFRQHCLSITNLSEYCFTRTDPHKLSNITSLCSQ